MNRKQEIITMINSISGSRSPYDVFCDWVKCMALAFANRSTLFEDEVRKKREEEYRKTIELYGGKSGEKQFGMMCGMLIETMQTNISDVLGEIYMEAGCGNKGTGQFFTPFHISEMCAKATLSQYKPGEILYLNEPSCGGGGMMIAVAKALWEQGAEYWRYMKVVTQDLDWKAVYMCYVQLSILGIDAIVMQKNSLEKSDVEEYAPERIFRTLRNRGALL